MCGGILAMDLLQISWWVLVEEFLNMVNNDMDKTVASPFLTNSMPRPTTTNTTKLLSNYSRFTQHQIIHYSKLLEIVGARLLEKNAVTN